MKIKVLSFTSHTDVNGVKVFQKQLDKFGYDYDLIITPFHWGQQQRQTYEWCLANRDNYSHMIYSDSWDVLFVGGMNEITSRLPDVEFLGSVEKAFFPPNEATQARYKPTESEWKYINAGGWFCSIERFIGWQEQVPSSGVNDQTWLHERYLDSMERGENVALDTNCDIFQSIAFDGGEDFAYDYENQRLVNNKTGSKPVILHANGRTDMRKVYALIGEPFKEVWEK